MKDYLDRCWDYILVLVIGVW